MELKECFNKFLESLDTSILNLLKNFLNMLLGFLTQMILKATFEYLKMGKDLLLIESYARLLENIYGSILSTVETLASYIKQFDYCDSVGDLSSIVKGTISNVANPYLKASRKMRSYLSSKGLKQLEMNTLNEQKENIQNMINAIDIELARRLSL